MTSSLIVAPSILAADPLNFAQELAAVERAGADWHHIDVMDGHFVPNLTFGLPLIAAIKRMTNLPLDVHIMVSNPDSVALQYVEAGADYLSFHIEAVTHAHRLVTAIQGAGARAGLAINPGTSLELLTPMLAYVDLINVMSVNPGFGGQSYIPETAERIATLSKMIKAANRQGKVLIQVDGGINERTYKHVCEAGADVLVAGTYVYGATDRQAAIAGLRA